MAPAPRAQARVVDAAASARSDGSGATLARLEPVFPLVLAAHGGASVLVLGQSWLLLLAFVGVAVLGAAGLAGWTSGAAVAVRAAACAVVALVVQVVEPELVSAMLQWYYVVAVYGLLLPSRLAVLAGPVAAACYLLQVGLGAGPVVAPVALMRAGVLVALGVLTCLAGRAYRAASHEAERGRAAAEQNAVELAHLATHDELTGLPNRVLLRTAVEDVLRAGQGAALLLLDLDRFKEVNDTLGHRYGDLLLRQVAQRLVDAAPDGAVVTRLGGDEFAVVVPGPADAADAVLAAQQLRGALTEPFQLLEAAVVVDVSTGVALSPEHGVDHDLLLQRADVAMYTAKGAGLGTAVYDPDTDQNATDRLSLLAELRGAVTVGELVVHYQAQVELPSGEPVGMEALVRWQHPRLGLLGPDVFIPLAERSGLIEPLTAWVLDEALAQARRWADAGHPMQVSVNLSARSLVQLDLPVRVDEALARAGVPASRLMLEITESFLMADPVRAQALLRQLRHRGVQVALDDFGTGMSSLSYLKDLPVDVLKIDKSFVRHVTTRPRDAVVLRGVLGLAQVLGLRTVAEGVEDAAALEVVTALGCWAAQGYHVARPAPADEATRWLCERPQPVPAPRDAAGRR